MSSGDEEKLLNEIQLERDKICELMEQINGRNYNFPSLALFEKYGVLDQISREALLSDDASNTEFQNASVLETLNTESYALIDDLAVAKQKREKTDIEMIELLKCITDMQEKTSAPSTSRAKPAKSKINFNAIEKNLNKRFAAEKKRLKTILQKILPEDEECLALMIELINRASRLHTYMDLEDKEGTAERVEFLVRSTFFEKNPDNPLQIRLKKLI